MSKADKQASYIAAFVLGCVILATCVFLQKRLMEQREAKAEFEQEQAARYHEMISRDNYEPEVQLHPNK